MFSLDLCLTITLTISTFADLHLHCLLSFCCDSFFGALCLRHSLGPLTGPPLSFLERLLHCDDIDHPDDFSTVSIGLDCVSAYLSVYFGR